MRKLILATILVMGLSIHSFSQSLAINTDGSSADASAILHVKSTVKGMIIPSMSKTDKNTIPSPATGLLIFQNAPDSVGFYFYNGTSWSLIPSLSQISSSVWNLLGNTGTNPATQFIGTTDAQDMVFKTSGSAAANERLRIIGAGGTPGQLVVNNTGIFAGDVFSAYASNTTNGSTASINNSIGTFAINGYGAGNGTGVYGEVNGGATTSGTSVWANIYGTANKASGTT